MFPAILIYTMKSHFVWDFFWENNLGPCKHSRCLFSVFFIQYMFAFGITGVVILECFARLTIQLCVCMLCDCKKQYFKWLPIFCLIFHIP